MLNKKAIAAFAAGATLLSGLAVAAPALAENTPAKAAATQAAPKADDAKLQAAKDNVKQLTRKVNEAQYKFDDAQTAFDKKVSDYNAAKTLVDAYKAAVKAYADAKAAADKPKADATETEKGALKDAEAAALKNLNTAIENANKNEELKKANQATVQAKADAPSADAYKEKLGEEPKKDADYYQKKGELEDLQAQLKTAQDALNALLKPAPVNPAPVNPAPVNPAPVNPAPKADPYKNVKPADLEHAKALMGQLEGEQKHFADAQAAADTAAKAVDTAKAAFEKAAGAALSAGAVKPGHDSINNVNFNYDFLSDFQYGQLTPEQKAAYDPFLAAAKDYANKVNASNAAAGAKKSADEKVRSLKLELKKLGVAVDGETPAPKPPVTPPAPKPTPKPTPKPEPGKVVVPKTKEELKAYVEQVKAALKAEKDAKKAEAVKAALAEFGKAAKAKDKAAFAAALKKLLGLVPYTPKTVTPTPKPGEPGIDVEAPTMLNGKDFKGMNVLLSGVGVTNTKAYMALLDQLQYNLQRGGWDSVIKGLGESDACHVLTVLRVQLKRAVKHYGHVLAAAQDMREEVKSQYDAAMKGNDPVAAAKLLPELNARNAAVATASGNLDRAKAILDSAEDHAKDLSCDTGAKDVLDAMKREPNFPGKPAPAPAPAPKPAPKTPKAPKLPNTGAVVALAAVAASVLAGMGAALRKIRH